MLYFWPVKKLLLILLVCFSFFWLTSCSLKVQKKTLHQPDDFSTLEGLDGQSPWLKVHMPDGRLYLLSQWHALEESRFIEGTGILMDARRSTLGTGEFSVPLDSVAILESNVIQNSPGMTTLTVLTVASLALTAYCIANPKACFGSCPTFFAPDENGKQIMLAEGFSASVAPSLEDRDVDTLYRAGGTGRFFTLTMTNEALETHVVRQADLLVVKKPPGQRVLLDQENTWWAIQKFQSPSRCIGSEGDVGELLASFDGEERISEADSFYLGAKEYLELNFLEIPEGPLGLVVASRHSLLSTFLFYQGLAYLGESAAPLLARTGQDSKTHQGSKNIGDLLGKIEIQVPVGPDGWRTVGFVGETGPLAINQHMLRLPSLNSDDSRIRLKMTKGNWRLDFVALVALGEELLPQRIQPTQVLQHGVPNAKALADLKSPDRTLISMPGDSFDLVYELPADASECELALESGGYYLEWMRTEWLEEEDPGMAALLFLQPKLALCKLAPKFKELEPKMEAYFWGSRYAF